MPIKPPFCQQCGYPYPALSEDAPAFVCNNCADRHWHFQWARAAYRTDGQVLEAVVGFKYADQYYQRRRLVEWLINAFDQHAGDSRWHALVPVPLYHRRHRERGFNQASEIAHGLGKARKIAVLDCLYRYRDTQTQTKLDRKTRWDNMTGAFQLKRRFDVKGKSLLLIDDVFTTGATVNACAQALASAGAGHLAVLTIARS